MADFTEHKLVTNIVPIKNILENTLGVIVHVFPDGDTFAVEFFSGGETIGVVTCKKEQLKLKIK